MNFIKLDRPIVKEFWDEIQNYSQTDGHWEIRHYPKKGTWFYTQNESLYQMVLENFTEQDAE